MFRGLEDIKSDDFFVKDSIEYNSQYEEME